MATTLLMDLTDRMKSTYKFINDGLLAFNNLTDAEKEAPLGMRAKNDPSEGNFATFNNVLCNSGRISIDRAAGIGQARYSKDLNRNHGCYVSGGRKGKRTNEPKEQNGTFHELLEKLQDSLLAIAKRNGNKSRKKFTIA